MPSKAIKVKKRLEKVMVWGGDWSGQDLYLHEYGQHGVRLSRQQATKGVTVTFIPYHAIDKIEHHYEEEIVV